MENHHFEIIVNSVFPKSETNTETNEIYETEVSKRIYFQTVKEIDLKKIIDAVNSKDGILLLSNDN